MLLEKTSVIAVLIVYTGYISEVFSMPTPTASELICKQRRNQKKNIIDKELSSKRTCNSSVSELTLDKKESRDVLYLVKPFHRMCHG